MKKILMLGWVGLVACGSSELESAEGALVLVPDNPCGPDELAGTTEAARPELRGTVVADKSVGFVCGGVDLVLQSTVVAEKYTGTLDFYYRVFTKEPLYAWIGGLQVSGF